MLHNTMDLMFPKEEKKWGVEGYNIPKYNAHLDKPSVYKIVKDKRPNYIDEFKKTKEYIPAPTHYNTIGSMINTRRYNLGKTERMTLPVEI